MFSSYSWKSKIYPMEFEHRPFEAKPDGGIHTMREALIGNTYIYHGHRNLRIPYGTVLGILTYKRFREPAIYDPKTFVGSYVCKFTNFSGEFAASEILGSIHIQRI